MKKNIMMLAAVIMAVSLTAAGCGQSGSSTADQSGSQEEPQTGDSELSGAEADFIWDGDTITDLSDEGSQKTDLVIPKRCTSVGSLMLDESSAVHVSFESDDDIYLGNMFVGADKIESVELPAGLTSIGDSAFSRCSSLASITIPEAVTSLGQSAFQDCTSLTSVTFEGTGLKVISDSAFDDCALTDVTIPEGVETIESSAFSDNSDLISVTLPSTIKTIDSAAFYCEKISEVHFKGGAQPDSINSFAFGVSAPNITVYISEGSWMDTHQDEWNIGFGTIAYE